MSDEGNRQLWETIDQLADGAWAAQPDLDAVHGLIDRGEAEKAALKIRVHEIECRRCDSMLVAAQLQLERARLELEYTGQLGEGD